MGNQAEEHMELGLDFQTILCPLCKHISNLLFPQIS